MIRFSGFPLEIKHSKKSGNEYDLTFVYAVNDIIVE
jgi:hypothetical protein